MTYPFSEFCKHLAFWATICTLERVDVNGKSIPITATMTPEMADQLRLMAMFQALGATQEEYGFRGQRFLAMQRFLIIHADDFAQAGFLLINFGAAGSVPAKVARSVHEFFRGDDSPPIEQVDFGQVVERAKSYPDGVEWNEGID